jgi:hypothetical protein
MLGRGAKHQLRSAGGGVMAFDLAISPHGDLVISGARDLQGCTGSQLNKQRIAIRLRIPRGSWTYDLTGSLGSDLRNAINKPKDQASIEIPRTVGDALRPMVDVEITDVQVEEHEGNPLVTVGFVTIIPQEEIGIGQSEISEPDLVQIPIGG